MLINFHPRKTGGSTVCGVAVENGAYPPEQSPEWAWLFPGLSGAAGVRRERMGHMDVPLISGCNCQVQLCWRQILSRYHSARSTRSLCEQGVRLLQDHGMEALAARRIACSLNMLRGWLTLPKEDWTQWARATHVTFINWEVIGINWVLYPRGLAALAAGAAPVILTIRQPLERIYSEFRMYADWKRSCFRSHGLTFGAWVASLLDKRLSAEKQRWCNLSWVTDDTLRMGPLGADNLLTRAMAARLNSSWVSLPAARAALRRFALVIDVPGEPYLSNVALEALTGWRGLSLNASARNRRPASSVYARHPREAARLEEYNQLDMQLYAEARSALVAHATALLAPAPPPSPPLAATPPAALPPPRSLQHLRIDALCARMAQDARSGAASDARNAHPPKMCYELIERASCERHFMGPRGSRWDARPCVWRPWEAVWPEDDELRASRGTDNQCQVLPQGSCAGVDVHSVAVGQVRGGNHG